MKKVFEVKEKVVFIRTYHVLAESSLEALKERGSSELIEEQKLEEGYVIVDSKPIREVNEYEYKTR